MRRLISVLLFVAPRYAASFPLAARRGAVAGLRARGCGLSTRGPLGHGKSHACVGVAWLELPWLARGGPRVIDGILARVVLGCLGLTECVRSLVCDAQTDDRTERGHGEVGALPQSLFPSSLPCASRVLPRADLVRPPARAGCRRSQLITYARFAW